MTVPSHLDQLTVQQFINCNKINNDTSLDALDKGIALLSEVTGKSIEYFTGDISNQWLKIYLSKVNQLFLTKPSEKPKRFIVVKGRVYKSIQLASELRDLMSANQFTTYSEYTKEYPINNMNLILPLMYSPYRLFRKPKLSDNQSKHAEVFKHARIGDVSGTAFFFARLYKSFTPVLDQMTAQAMKTISDHMEEIKTFGKVSGLNMDGTKH